MLKFETIYKLTPYFVEYEDGKDLYPSFKLARDVFSLHRTWQQAMYAMRPYGEPPAEMCDRLMRLWNMVK